jgi:putative flippase GtrA
MTDNNQPITVIQKILFSVFNRLIVFFTALPGLRQFVVLPQFLRFATVGIFNTTIDFTVYIGLTRGLIFFSKHYLLANFLAFLTANLFSFWANKSWTFQNNNQHKIFQYSKFFTVSMLALLVIQLTMYVGISIFGWWDLATKILALLFSVFINFFGSKFWAFK